MDLNLNKLTVNEEGEGNRTGPCTEIQTLSSLFKHHFKCRSYNSICPTKVQQSMVYIYKYKYGPHNIHSRDVRI